MLSASSHPLLGGCPPKEHRSIWKFKLTPGKTLARFLEIPGSSGKVRRYKRANRWTAPKKGMPTKCPKNVAKKNPKIVWRSWENTIFAQFFGTIFAYLVDYFSWRPCPVLARYKSRRLKHKSIYFDGAFWVLPPLPKQTQLPLRPIN